MISIITPTYNAESCIENCIKNVIDQKYDNLEHIIVDGASTDRTVSIIKEYADKYSHIRWLSEKDQGQSDALNKGILMSQGKIIGILNADDYYEPNIINEIAKFFLDLPEPSLLVGKCNVWSEQGLRYVYTPRSLKLVNLLIGQKFHPTPVNPAGYFYHRSLHDLVGLYDVNQKYAMDFDFLYRAVPQAHIVKVKKVLGNFNYIAGTKTYQNLVLNDGKNQNQLLRKKFFDKMSFVQKIEFYLLFIYSHIEYFIRSYYFQGRNLVKQIILNLYT